MSEAVAEAPAKWVMPKPRKGQCILFYPGGTVSKHNAEIAFATRVGEKTIHCAYRSSGYDSVFHVDDPRLKENLELRRQIPGVWDFTDSDKETTARIEALEQDLEKIKEVLRSRSKTTKPASE